MKRLLLLSGVLAFAAIIFSPGCNDDLFSNKDANGIVSISITDAPFDISLIESATVTITSVEIRKSGVADSVPFISLLDKPFSFDLMKLRNGIKEELVKAAIPIGTYDNIRLITSEASLKIKGGGLFTLKIPSGPQTGIKVKIDPAVVVETKLSSDLLIDFDLSKSFVLKGNLNKPDGINGFNFKPSFRAVNMSTAGTIEGMVTDTELKKIVGASVWVKRDTIYAKAFTDTLGKYVLPGIPVGTYTVGAHKESFDSLLFTGVKVIAGNNTTRNFALKKL